jgi:hypothetical protein
LEEARDVEGEGRLWQGKHWGQYLV